MDFLKNVTNAQIIDFVQQHRGGFNDINVKRSNADEVVEITADEWGRYDEDDKTYKYFYGPYGEMVLTDTGFKLRPYTEDYAEALKSWMDLVYNANQTIVYLSKFKQAHIDALINQEQEEYAAVEAKIRELIDSKKEIKNNIESKSQALIGFIDKRLAEAKRVEYEKNSLIVRSFLSNMTEEERNEWMAENGFNLNADTDAAPVDKAEKAQDIELN